MKITIGDVSVGAVIGRAPTVEVFYETPYGYSARVYPKAQALKIARAIAEAIARCTHGGRRPCMWCGSLRNSKNTKIT